MAKSVRPVYDPYADLIAGLNKAHVDYVVVGMSGINYYASSAGTFWNTGSRSVLATDACECRQDIPGLSEPWL